jgi:hypothetical protein
MYNLGPVPHRSIPLALPPSFVEFLDARNVRATACRSNRAALNNSNGLIRLSDLAAWTSDTLSPIRTLDAESKLKSALARNTMPGLGFRSSEYVLANSMDRMIGTVIHARDLNLLLGKFEDDPLRQLQEIRLAVVSSRDSGLVRNHHN